ncbi:uncharacterized protein [Pleurodeles waltl]|uniref:uncharacterized protein n=1 Tax=Pleurodeles waltl TaxID=8319 RepID=UPI0037096DEA
MAYQDRGQWLEKHHAHIRAVRQKIGLMIHPNVKVPPSQNVLINGSSKAALVNLYLSGKELPKEVEKQSGQSGVESLKQGYAEILRISQQSSSASSAPKQRMIDTVLARRSIERSEKKEIDEAVIRKLNEEREELQKELTKLRLQMKHFTNAPPQDVGNSTSLGSRIASTKARLPALESRVQLLRVAHFKKEEERLKPYLKTSLLPGAQSHRPQDIEMVRALLSELVEEVMDDYLRRVPEGVAPDAADQLRLQGNESSRAKMSHDYAVELIGEQLILETTLEMAKQAADEVLIVNRMGVALGFDLIFNAVRRARRPVTASEPSEDTISSEGELTGMLLQQIKEREVHRKEVWKHTLKERPSSE